MLDKTVSNSCDDDGEGASSTGGNPENPEEASKEGVRGIGCRKGTTEGKKLYPPPEDESKRSTELEEERQGSEELQNL